MRKKINLQEKRFGRLIVVEEAPKNKHGGIMWDCLCDCGNKTIVSSSCLRRGHTKSCGCYNSKLSKERNTKHGFRYHPIYGTWKSMLSRCCNPKHKHYEYYGGRGISVCPGWKDSPKEFILWAENHGWKKGLEIDRRDNDKGYSPDNCRIVEHSANLLNSRLLRSNNSSGFRGVSWEEQRKRYSAYVTCNGKQYRLGRFLTAIEAARTRDAFVIKKGLHAPLNFPDAKKKEMTL